MGCWSDDPPLTAKGREQAGACGGRLRQAFMQLMGHQTDDVPTCRRVPVFASPLQRALRTAEAVGAALAASEIRVLPGLSECAAAVRYESVPFAYPKMLFALGTYSVSGSVALQGPENDQELNDTFPEAVARAVGMATA